MKATAHRNLQNKVAAWLILVRTATGQRTLSGDLGQFHKAVKALNELADWDDAGANFALEAHGTWSSFAEPHATKVARETLKEIFP